MEFDVSSKKDFYLSFVAPYCTYRCDKWEGDEPQQDKNLFLYIFLVFVLRGASKIDEAAFNFSTNILFYRLYHKMNCIESHRLNPYYDK